jgi:hypothetical protein
MSNSNTPIHTPSVPSSRSSSGTPVSPVNDQVSKTLKNKTEYPISYKIPERYTLTHQ